ncbi:MAG: hypothetical protein IT364_17035 [Candidatus Hydrogenedentes bacterium]|nr:hypothetical protein [Candidatus Hydrogenedentota bacterium]
MELSDGDTIQVGETVLQVSVKGGAQTTSQRCDSCGRDFQTRELPQGFRPAVCPDCRATTPGPAPADAEAHEDDSQDTARSMEVLARAGYKVERELGRGGMAIVYLARRPGEPDGAKTPVSRTG